MLAVVAPVALFHRGGDCAVRSRKARGRFPIDQTSRPSSTLFGEAWPPFARFFEAGPGRGPGKTPHSRSGK